MLVFSFLPTSKVFFIIVSNYAPGCHYFFLFENGDRILASGLLLNLKEVIYTKVLQKVMFILII